MANNGQPAGSILPQYSDQPLPQLPTLADLRSAGASYGAICRANLEAIVDRFEAHGGTYPFVDTKLDLNSGQDFPVDDAVRGRGTIYGWIQGRGLEALAGHGAWLERQGHGDLLAEGVRRMTRVVLESVRRLRAANGGHLFFFMEPEGTPFTLGKSGRQGLEPLSADAPSNFSDLFGAKGLLAAARYLGDRAVQAEAQIYAQRVTADIWAGRFISDQQPLDPTNPIAHVPGRFDHGPFMIHLGTCALGAAAGDREAVATGLDLLEHELAHHANLNGRIAAPFEEGDFWESIDADGAPYRDEEGRVLCDPGHALEFVGLALKFGRAAAVASPAQQRALEKMLAPMPILLERNFAHGFLAGPGGICKAFDLVKRRHISTDMPWWSLPETIRAAALCWARATDETVRRQSLQIWAACHNAFVGHFVRPQVHLMSVQTRSADGQVSGAIPATADADPGYHTGLSLLDVIEVLDSIGDDC